MSRLSDSRIALILLAIIVVVTIVAGAPFVTGVLLPVLTGLFVIYANRWHKAQRTLPAAAGSRSASDRLARLVDISIRAARKEGSSYSTSHESRLVLTATLLLFVFGAVMVYSASSTRPGLFVHEEAAIGYFVRFVIFGSIGVVMMLVLARNGLRLARHLTAALLIVSFALVLGTHIPHLGIDVNGARRWIGSGDFQFQPSELMKLALVLYGAELIARRPSRVYDFSELAQPFLYVVGSACPLIATQPDLGTAIVIAFAVTALLLGAGLQMRTFAAIVGSGLLLLALYSLIRPYASMSRSAWNFGDGPCVNLRRL